MTIVRINKKIFSLLSVTSFILQEVDGMESLPN